MRIFLYFSLFSCVAVLNFFVPVYKAASLHSSEGGAIKTETAEECVFVLRYGEDIVSVEWYSRTSQKVSSRVVVNEAHEFRYTLDLQPQGNVSRFELVSPQPDGKPPSKSNFLLLPDKNKEMEGQTNDKKYLGVAPYFDQAPVGMLEQIVRRARIVGSNRVEVPIFRFVDKKTLPATVTFKASDFAEVEIGGKVLHFVVDREGRILGGQIPAYGITIERLPSLPDDAYAAWSAYGTPPNAPYKAEEIRVPTPQGHILAGTLTLPRNIKGRVPAVVLITGSSRNNRNNGNLPSVPFRQIADALSRQGIAVIRVDDRGVGGSTGDAATATTFDEADDIRSVLRYLRQRRDIDSKRLGLVGWSEGGIIAPMIAATDPTLRGIVLMAGPAQGRETAEYQIRYIVEHEPTIPPEKREQIINDMLAGAGDSARIRSFLGIDGIPNAVKVKTPVLLLQGMNDRNVPPWSATRLATAFRSNGNSDISVRLFPNLNHIFLPDPDGRASGWSFLPSMSVPSEVLNILTDWVVRHFR